MKDFYEIVIDRLWHSYETITLRRRKSFYSLYYSMIVVGILLISPQSDGRIKLYIIELEPWVLLIVSPAIILLLVNNYLYLSAHTVVSYSNYLTAIIGHEERKLKENKQSFSQLYNSFRIRDVTTNLNPFNFPIRVSLAWDRGINDSFRKMAVLFINISIILSYIIPAAMFIILIKRNIELDVPFDNSIKISVLIIYSVLGLSLILSPFFFWSRARHHKERIDQKFYEDNSVFSETS